MLFIVATLVAWLLRFFDYILNKGTKKGRKSLSEIRSSSKKILQLMQRMAFSEYIDSLSGGSLVECQSKFANRLRVLMEVTLHVGGRIRQALITLKVAHPTVLPKEHSVPSLIARYFHEILGHAGHEHVVSIMHQQFWIIESRSLHHVLRKCIYFCKRNESPI